MQVPKGRNKKLNRQKNKAKRLVLGEELIVEEEPIRKRCPSGHGSGGSDLK
jgi:hypothetical protein